MPLGWLDNNLFVFLRVGITCRWCWLLLSPPHNKELSWIIQGKILCVRLPLKITSLLLVFFLSYSMHLGLDFGYKGSLLYAVLSLIHSTAMVFILVRSNHCLPMMYLKMQDMLWHFSFTDKEQRFRLCSSINKGSLRVMMSTH